MSICESLCWSCQNSVRFGCSWAKEFQPVYGWDATRRDLRVSKNVNIESYCVYGCPLFVSDEARNEV